MQHNSLNHEMLCLGPCQLIALLHSSIRPVYCYLYIIDTDSPRKDCTGHAGEHIRKPLPKSSDELEV